MHYSNIFEAGLVHVKGDNGEAAAYFENSTLITTLTPTPTGLAKLSEEQFFAKFRDDKSCSVSLYRMSATEAYLWAEAASSKEVYSNLSTEFVDLDNLFERLKTEEHSGTVIIDIPDDRAVLLLQNGSFIGGLYSWRQSESINKDTTLISEVHEKLRHVAGTITVFHRINTADIEEISVQPNSTPSLDEEKAAPEPAKSEKTTAEISEDLSRLIQMIESHLKSTNLPKPLERMIKEGFARDAVKFAFLDPFSAELQYSASSITYTGTEPAASVYKGVQTSITATAALYDLNLNATFYKWQMMIVA